MYFTLHQLQSSLPMNLILEQNTQTGQGALWLGDLQAANDSNKLREKDIKTVITVASGLNVSLSPSITHKYFNILDLESQNIKRIWNETYLQISEGLKRGSVLVHCAAGISRSASTVIAFLMKKNQISCDEAFNFVKKKRPIIFPNFGFQRQLREYEKELQENTQPLILPQKVQIQTAPTNTFSDIPKNNIELNSKDAFMLQLQQVWTPPLKKTEDLAQLKEDEMKKQFISKPTEPIKKQSDNYYQSILSTGNKMSQVNNSEQKPVKVNYHYMNHQQQINKQVNDFIKFDSQQVNKAQTPNIAQTQTINQQIQQRRFK